MQTVASKMVRIVFYCVGLPKQALAGELTLLLFGRSAKIA
jgi:hypothetical protein